ncbi:M56 family peptidase [Mycobacterium sp. PS03-16]|uniref:M56 family metallopeptidase n=1 Tax=Mycobacterium sp. PS03-16 TaxID=2559611 RepID=UPI0010746E62|nr:M56 family metallopeptidase [Mycobacterium sp. PS03-16]TFV55212.1 M56 family peptidase [Mycobacterium sp. PS03-16]
MTGLLCLLAYAVGVSVCAPVVLDRFGSRGTLPRLAIAAWIATLLSVAAAWMLATVSLLAGNRMLAGALAAAAAVGVAGRWLRQIRRLRSRSDEHAHAARLLGAVDQATGAVVIPATAPAAYCVAGRPDTVVVTTGALHALEPPHLAAVLAHEDAHVRGRHPHALILLRALARAVPLLPLFRRAPAAVGRLLEMRADDVAARGHGAASLLAGLLTVAGPAQPVAGAVGAAHTAVLARVRRLAHPPSRFETWWRYTALTATITAVVVAPLPIAAICHG